MQLPKNTLSMRSPVPEEVCCLRSLTDDLMGMTFFCQALSMPLHMWVRYVSHSTFELLGQPSTQRSIKFCAAEEGSISAKGLSHNMSPPAIEPLASFGGDLKTGCPDCLSPHVQEFGDSEKRDSHDSSQISSNEIIQHQRMINSGESVWPKQMM